MPLVLFTMLGFLVMGYHPGFEDDGIYLAAVKADLNPALFPHDSDFFRLQVQATAFDGCMARFVSITAIPLPWAELLWQFATLFLILCASRKIASLLFAQIHAQWSAVATVAALFTLPVAGTALNIADQHLHPRNLATALILAAVCRILENKRWQAIVLLALAFLMHPLMAVMGISFSVFLAIFWRRPARLRLSLARHSVLAAIPMSWVFAPQTPGWRQALASRTYYSIYRWTWYEWLGALAPLLLFWMLARVTRAPAADPGLRTSIEHDPFQLRLHSFALAVFSFAIFHQVLAMLLLAPQSLERLTPLQPMRYLHLVYLFMALIAGGLLGRFLLRQSPWRWAIFLLLINGGMFLVQRNTIDAGAHLELPNRHSANPWLQAFDWIRANTPVDAYFALDPHYLETPGEGFHGFRALAERSQLADAIKDTAVVVQVPSLAPIWQQQLQAQSGWKHFQLADFERLKARFGVNWVLLDYAPPAGLDCRWHNEALTVCTIP